MRNLGYVEVLSEYAINKVS